MDFQLALKTLDDLALSVVQARTATISWCDGASFLLNRACTFQFATSPATPYSLLLLFPACFTHFPATQMQLEKGCWHIVGGAGVGEGGRGLSQQKLCKRMALVQTIFLPAREPLYKQTLHGIAEFEYY